MARQLVGHGGASKGDTLAFPIYLPADFRAPFVDPSTATGPAVLEILTHPERYVGQTLPSDPTASSSPKSSSVVRLSSMS